MVKAKDNGRIIDEMAGDDSAKARQILEQDKQYRAQAFSDELSLLAQKYRCGLVAQLTIRGSEMRSEVLVVAQ